MEPFKCTDTQSLFEPKHAKRFKEFEPVALRKLVQLHAATTLDFLRIPPGNRLEALRGGRLGQHSIPLTINGGFAWCGVTAMLTTLRSWTITRR